MPENSENIRMCVNRFKMCENQKNSASGGDGEGGLL